MLDVGRGRYRRGTELLSVQTAMLRASKPDAAGMDEGMQSNHDHWVSGIAFTYQYRSFLNPIRLLGRTCRHQAWCLLSLSLSRQQCICT